MTKTTSNVRTSRKTHRRSLRLTAEQIYYMIQKLIGVACIILGVVGAFILQSFPVMMVGVGIGIGCLMTKEKIIMASDVYWDENPKRKHENSINKYTENPCKNKQNML